MTPMTAMTMNCRGSLNGVAALFLEMKDAVMGREYGERKCDKARRCSRPTRPLGVSIAQHSSSSQRSPGPLRAPIPYPDETFTIVVVVSSDTSLIACTPSSPGSHRTPEGSPRRDGRCQGWRQVKDEARGSPVRFLEYPFLPEGQRRPP